MEKAILELLGRKPGLKSREVARELAIEKEQANSILWVLKNRRHMWQDKSYRWFVGVQPQSTGKTEAPLIDTPLARLCRYYLQCLSQTDEGGVSLFAQSQFNSEYIEIPQFPDLDHASPSVLGFDSIPQFFEHLRSAATRLVPFVGYPVRLRFHRARSGWEGYKVEPIFLFEFAADSLLVGATPKLSWECPGLNFHVLRSFAVGDESQVMDEAARLADELGFGEQELPELDEVVRRLVALHDDWGWQEEMDPAHLSQGQPLNKLQCDGVYNRAIVFGIERSPYTKGLEQELVKLKSMPESQYRDTALGAWLKKDFSAFQKAFSAEDTFLEPLPLNSEQRDAVAKALSQPLTVITGPPGTGKSQVVSSILINAAKRGDRVLFASKNNRAVDVVEARVNSLGSRPILLRLGRGEYQANLSDYLTGLLASHATPEDLQHFKEAEVEYAATLKLIHKLQNSAKQVVELRNRTDAAERAVECIRDELGPEWFSHFRHLNPAPLETALTAINNAVDAATREKQPWFKRVFWFAVQKKAFERLWTTFNFIHQEVEQCGVDAPPKPASCADIPQWCSFRDRLRHRITLVEAVHRYQNAFADLAATPRLEQLAEKCSTLTKELSEQALKVWSSWLRIAPARLSIQDRQTLGEFGAVLRLIAQSDAQGQFAGKQVFRQYYTLFPRLVKLLPCWAVTSLSVRGRIPLEPGFFDLLVIDEASQCDIASALPLLYRSKAAVIIGDPKQLRHISAISVRQDRTLLEQHGMIDGYLNWAFSENSLYDLASPLARSENIVQFRDHHRSHGHIIEFSNRYFYDGRLRVATKYEQLRRPSHDGPAVRWIAVDGMVTRPGSGALNDAEAQAVIRELARLALEQGYRGSVGVVTPFRAQANRIRDLVHAHPQSELIIGNLCLLVDTVHRFQGDERDVMIFSPVLSRGISSGASGFLNKTGNLFNVAITRARAALIVVGDLNAARNGSVKHLTAFADYVTKLADTYRDERNSNNAYDGGPKYPPVSHPELVLSWEHVLYECLYSAGLRPIPQYDLEKYTLDFALLSGNRRLNIEVDGEYHRDWTGELLRRDQLRNMRLIELGWDVMRFWVYELRDEMETCVQRVKTWADSYREKP